MTVRNLDYLFKPSSVALIGASDEAQSVGAVITSNLLSGDFKGSIDLVNPHYLTIGGVRVHKDVAALPEPPDLAVIVTPPATIPGIISELAQAGTRAAVVISTGFAETEGQEGFELRQTMLDAARPSLLRINGPNCVGIMVPRIGLNASFAHTAPLDGRIAFVAQSGAIVTSVLDWAKPRGIGFSHLVSLGDMADVDFGDLLDYFANDFSTAAILLYVESITNARKFMSAARAAARSKPVILVKSGRYVEVTRTVVSNSEAMAGTDAVYDAAIRRAGMLRVHTLDELFGALESLAIGNRPKGDRLAILSNGGGIGLLAADGLIERGGRLAEISDDTLARLNMVLPATWSHTNPVDIIDDAPSSRYADAFRILLRDPDIDAILILNSPTAVASGTEAAQAVIDVVKKHPHASVFTSWVGDGAAIPARCLFIDHGIPTYDTPDQAVRAFMQLVDYHRNQTTLMQTPPSVPDVFTPSISTAKSTIDHALQAGRDWLTAPEAKTLLSAYGIPSVQTLIAESPDAAARAMEKIGQPVALKILSPDIKHRSDMGGVVLDLEDATAVRQAAEGMLQRVQATRPEARVDGFTVQSMVRRPGCVELILGVIEDRQFGPVLLFGHGGNAVEVINDKALGLPPLNMHLAREMMKRTRVYKLLQGYSDQPTADLEAVALTLVRLSQLVVDLAEIVKLDINPLLVDAKGVLAMDARIKVEQVNGSAGHRLAIRPYPKKLEEEIPLEDGSRLLLRPILPEDEPALQAVFAKLTAEEIRLRFFAPINNLSHVTAARFTQIDYDREMALILTKPGIPGKTEIFGVVRIIADPDNERAEYSIIVHHDMTGKGLGILLMRRIIDYARSRGIGEIYGDVLHENRAMLKLCRAMGFSQARVPGEPGIVKVTLKLSTSSSYITV